jgi:hypothetical protein
MSEDTYTVIPSEIGKPAPRLTGDLAGTVTAAAALVEAARRGASTEALQTLTVGLHAQTSATVATIHGEVRPPAEHACIECGAQFVPGRSDRIYCTERCSARARMRRMAVRRRGLTLS